MLFRQPVSSAPAFQGRVVLSLLAAVLFATALLQWSPFDYETFAADDGPTAPSVPAAAEDEYPGKDEGFERSVDSKGSEVYRFDCSTPQAQSNKLCLIKQGESCPAESGSSCTASDCMPQGCTQQGCMLTGGCMSNQVYVIPSDQYYDWRANYYTGSLTSSMLHMLLFAHIYSMVAYRPTFFHSTVIHTYHAPTTSYYHSSAYTSHFGSPSVVNGRVAHTPMATAVRSTSPVARAGTPVAQARPVVQGRPVGGSSAIAQGRPVGGSSAIAQGRPVATSSYRSSGSSWGRVSSYHRTSSSFSSFRGCFGAGALVSRPDGSVAPIETMQAGELVAGWSSAAEASRGEPPRPIRIASVRRMVHEPAVPLPMLLGMELRLPNGKAVTLQPFVTPNHAVLDAAGSWRAADAHAAQAELDHFFLADAAAGAPRGVEKPTLPSPAVPVEKPTLPSPAVPVEKPTLPSPAVPVRIAPLTAGTTLLVAPRLPAAPAQNATLEAILQPTEGAPPREVYSLELEVAGLAAYVVNGLLVVD